MTLPLTRSSYRKKSHVRNLRIYGIIVVIGSEIRDRSRRPAEEGEGSGTESPATNLSSQKNTLRRLAANAKAKRESTCEIRLRRRTTPVSAILRIAPRLSRASLNHASTTRATAGGSRTISGV